MATNTQFSPGDTLWAIKRKQLAALNVLYPSAPASDQFAVGDSMWALERKCLNILAGEGEAPPTGLDVTGAASANGNTVLTWSSPVNTPDSYEIWVGKNGAAYSRLAVVSGSSSTYTDTNLMSTGDEWDYQVRGVTGGIPSAFSTPAGVVNNLVVSPSVNVALSYPNVVVAYTTFGWAFNNNHVTSWAAPRLHTAGEIRLSDNAMVTSISLPVLVSASMVGLDNNAIITTLALPALVSVTGDPSIGLGILRCATDPLLTSFSAPKLVSISGSLDISSCNALTSVNLSSLVSIGMDWNASSNPALATLAFPALTTIGTAPGSSFCGTAGDTVLSTLSAPSIQFPFVPGYTVDDSACALNVASVNQVLRRLAAGGVTGYTIDLSGGTNAHPTGQGLIDKAFLQASGNTVTTN